MSRNVHMFNSVNIYSLGLLLFTKDIHWPGVLTFFAKQLYINCVKLLDPWV